MEKPCNFMVCWKRCGNSKRGTENNFENKIKKPGKCTNSEILNKFLAINSVKKRLRSNLTTAFRYLQAKSIPDSKEHSNLGGRNV